MVRKANLKCAKCGVTSEEDSSLTFHRFPFPDTHRSLKAKVWAKFCFPENNWTSNEALKILYAQKKMLCGNHFDNSSFTNSKRQRLNNFAIPAEAHDILRQVRDEQGPGNYTAHPPTIPGTSYTEGSDNMENKQSAPRYVAVEEIKIEYDDDVASQTKTDQEVIAIDHITSTHTESRPTTSELIDKIEADHNEAPSHVKIKTEITTDYELTPKHLLNCDIKVNENEMKRGSMVNRTSIDNYNEVNVVESSENVADTVVKIENVLLGEDYSSNNCLNSAGLEQSTVLSVTGVKQETEVPTDILQVKIEPVATLSAVAKRTDVTCRSQTNNEQPARRSKAPTGPQRHRCHLCSYQTKCKIRLTDHCNKHLGIKPYSCNVCSKSFIYKSSLTVHMRTHSEERPFACTICPNAYKIRRHLVEHIRIHTGEKPFSCDYCGKAFKLKTGLVFHIRMHTGKKPFECHICHKEFCIKKDLARHVKFHTGTKPFTCHICDKAFHLKCSLSRHEKTHLEGKPFSCHICYKRFKVNISLMQHIKMHTGEKPFECDICGKTFIVKGRLRKHIDTHYAEKPYPCHICDEAFKIRKHLRKHIKTHVGVKQFSCEVCHKKFVRQHSLATHMRVHTGQVFSCVCGKTFVREKQLKIHSRTCVHRCS